MGKPLFLFFGFAGGAVPRAAVYFSVEEGASLVTEGTGGSVFAHWVRLSLFMIP